jgi:hypothetical protein
MHANTAYASLGAPQVEPSADCPWLDRAACARGEYQTIGGPGGARLLSRERMRSCAWRTSAPIAG